MGGRQAMNAKTSRIRLTLILAALFVAVVPAAASAAPQGPWQVPATDLSPSEKDASPFDLAIGPDGGALAVWGIQDGSNRVIQAATRPPGGAFGTPFDLSGPAEEAVNPNVAIGSDGTAAVAWLRVDGPELVGRVATRAPGGSFGTPEDLSVAGDDIYNPRVGAGPDGSITAVWSLGPGLIQASTRPPGGSFGEPVDLSATGADVGAQIAIGPDGAATVVWQRAGIIQASARPPGGSFGAPVDLSETGQSALGERIAIGPDKTTIVSWYTGRCDIVGPCVIQAATRPPGGSFGEAVDLSAASQNSDRQQIAIGPDGAATAVWRVYDGTWLTLQTADRPPGGSFGAPVDLTETGNYSGNPDIAIGPDGTSTVVWEFSTPGSPGCCTPSVIQSATRPPGGSFGATASLSAGGQDASGPLIAIGPDGTATSIWKRSNGTNEILQTASTASPLYALGVNRSGSGQGTVTSSPGGIDCGAECVEVFTSLTEVTLTAAADAVSNFTGWSGACSGTGSCVVTMDQARSVSASFELQQRALTVTKNGNGAGSVTSTPAGIDCGPTCSSDFDYGTEVTLTAAAAEGSTFTGWGGACSGTGSCVVTMDQARSVSASFELQQRTLTLTKNGNGAGSVTSTPAGIDCGPTCSSDFDYGTEVTLTAAAAEGSTFTGWGGACSGTGSCVVTMDQARSVSATFELQESPLAVAKISKVKVKGPAKVKRKKKATYKVKIKNSGNAKATGVRVKVKGRGVNFKKSIGKIGAKKTRTVKIRLKPKKPGKVKLKFKVTSKNAGGRTVKKKIRVKK